MQKIILYPHGGSENHGCEALVRSTVKILGDNAEIILVSKNPEQDMKYGLDRICTIVPQHTSSSKLHRLLTTLKYHLGDKLAYERQTYRDILKYIDGNSICLSFGGDNYCYGKPVYIYNMNKLFRQKGAKTILWGCSIEPANIDAEMLEDLSNYDKIITRETLTQNELIKRGLTNVFLAPDPAFILDSSEVSLFPPEFIPDNTVGINLSPMALSYSADNILTFQNYKNLIMHIFENTDMNVALIPHVVWNDNDDREPLMQLFSEFKNTGRICIFSDHNCQELKWIIAKCRFVITARTHASIAAYSSCIPTLVLGYSIKARGLAIDLFGTDKGYVLPVQSLNNEKDLTKAFIKIADNESRIKASLSSQMKEYSEAVKQMRTFLC